MAATKGDKPFRHKATNVTNRSHGQLLQRLNSYAIFSKKWASTLA